MNFGARAQAVVKLVLDAVSSVILNRVEIITLVIREGIVVIAVQLRRVFNIVKKVGV